MSALVVDAAGRRIATFCLPLSSGSTEMLLPSGRGRLFLEVRDRSTTRAFPIVRM